MEISLNDKNIVCQNANVNETTINKIVDQLRKNKIPCWNKQDFGSANNAAKIIYKKYLCNVINASEYLNNNQPINLSNLAEYITQMLKTGSITSNDNKSDVYILTALFTYIISFTEINMIMTEFATDDIITKSVMKILTVSAGYFSPAMSKDKSYNPPLAYIQNIQHTIVHECCNICEQINDTNRKAAVKDSCKFLINNLYHLLNANSMVNNFDPPINFKPYKFNKLWDEYETKLTMKNFENDLFSNKNKTLFVGINNFSIEKGDYVLVNAEMEESSLKIDACVIDINPNFNLVKIKTSVDKDEVSDRYLFQCLAMRKLLPINYLKIGYSFLKRYSDILNDNEAYKFIEKMYERFNQPLYSYSRFDLEDSRKLFLFFRIAFKAINYVEEIPKIIQTETFLNKIKIVEESYSELDNTKLDLIITKMTSGAKPLLTDEVINNTLKQIRMNENIIQENILEKDLDLLIKLYEQLNVKKAKEEDIAEDVQDAMSASSEEELIGGVEETKGGEDLIEEVGEQIHTVIEEDVVETGGGEQIPIVIEEDIVDTSGRDVNEIEEAMEMELPTNETAQREELSMLLNEQPPDIKQAVLSCFAGSLNVQE